MLHNTPMKADVPVLIVGGGPVGLTLAIDLARRGQRVLLVEQRSGPSEHPKATLLGMPLTLQPLTDEGVARLYACRRVLVRPDGHVAWRGERLPDDLDSLLDQIRGATAAGVRA